MGPCFRRYDGSRMGNAAEFHHDVTLALCRANASFSKSCAIGIAFSADTLVMPGLVPGIHVFLAAQGRKTWMAGTDPGHHENGALTPASPAIRPSAGRARPGCRPRCVR